MSEEESQFSIMGIDASLTHTGVSVIYTNGANHREHTCIPKTKGAERLTDIEDWLDYIVCEIATKTRMGIFCGVMEGYAYTPVYGQAFSLGELGGIIKRYFYRKDISLYIVQPQTLKKFITGEGKGDKNMIMLKAFKKWGLEFCNDHTCDAYGLAMIGRALYDIEHGKSIKEFFEYEQEVIKLIRKQEK